MEKPESILQLERKLGFEIKISTKKNILSLQGERNYSLDPNGEIVGLNLSNCSITDIKFLSDFPNLASLNLGRNPIKEIGGLNVLTNLTHLNLAYTEIVDHSAIKDLQNLIFLNVAENKFDLSYLEKLDKIKILNLTQTGLKDLSVLENKNSLLTLFLGHNQISDVSYLRNLTQLNFLYLHNNQISDISPLKELKELITLTLSNNRIKDVFYLKDLHELKKIMLTDNQITDISPIGNLTKLIDLYFGINHISEISGLTKLVKLKSLKANDNNIVDIAALKYFIKLEQIDLSRNKIKDLSPLINLIKTGIPLKFEKLNDNYLIINGNPLEYPPLEVVSEGNRKIVEWFKEIEKYGEEPLYEAKLLIVGEPNAGKTSLREKLIDPDYKIVDGKIQETIGVYVHDGYNFSYYKNTSITITSHIWDFGGQEKQYPLHQYFLKDKSVYALLSLDRSDNQYLDKWFSIVRLLSGNENEIILVLNQKNRTSQSSNFNKTKYENQGFRFKEHILDLSRDKERFEELQNNIQTALADLPHIGSLFPKYCKAIADEIDKKRFNDKKDYLIYEEYEDLCLKLDLRKDDVPKKALDYLNIIGKVIHYEDDCNLERIIIINPHWLIDAIYGVLTCEYLDEFHEKGRFTKSWLIEYLKKPTTSRPSGYKESESLHILNLMLKNHFDICYEVGDIFLIPLCMPEILPDNDFDINDGIQVLFKYEVMPSGIVARILVRLNEYIEENLISKTSGILKNKNNRAIVEEYYLPNDANKYIRIIVNGNLNTRKEFLYLIKNELIKIQKDWFDKLEVNELIPCNCHECKNLITPHHFETKELQKALSKNKYTKECKISSEDINIFELFGEVYDLGTKQKISSIEDIKMIMHDENEADNKITQIFNFFGDNPQIKDLITMGDNFDISGDNANSQFGGKKNNQNNFHNVYHNNDSIVELKEILKELKDAKGINEDWQRNFTEAFVEVCKLEDAKEKHEITKSISFLQKFFLKAKEAKDWVAIGMLPAEIITKGDKMIELGNELLKLFVK